MHTATTVISADPSALNNTMGFLCLLLMLAQYLFNTWDGSN
jgi:hypothetical protein